MKALVLHKAGDCRYEKNWPEPKPKKGLVLVKVKYSGICGSDLPRMMMTGAYRHPIICGHEFMGETKKGDIVAVLPLIPCFKCSACNEQQYFHCKSYDFLGSRIDGGFAQYCLVPEKNLFLLPKEMDKRYGVFIEPLSVALHVVRNSGFKVGQKALIFGAGAIGILIGMWLKIFGARQITIVDLRKESLEIAFKSGFNEVVNPQDKHFQKYQDYDVCFEAAGSGLALLSALEKAKRCGGVTVVGRDTKDINIPHNIFESFMRKEISIYGCWGYNNTGENEFIYQMLKENRFNFEPLITHTIALSEGEKTIKQMFNKEIFFCKAIFAI